MPSPGGQISGIANTRTAAAGPGARGVASPRPPGGLPHASPGTEPDDAHTRSVEGCPRAAVWSGCARSTGCHTTPACKINLWAVTGPSDVEKYEKPGEVARAFLVINPAASPHQRRRQGVGRTSWPVSRIQTPPRPVIVHVVTSAARAPAASLRDGCATLAPAITTSKAARTRGRGGPQSRA
jgi:hypothetical protein